MLPMAVTAPMVRSSHRAAGVTADPIPLNFDLGGTILLTDLSWGNRSASNCDLPPDRFH